MKWLPEHSNCESPPTVLCVFVLSVFIAIGLVKFSAYH